MEEKDYSKTKTNKKSLKIALSVIFAAVFIALGFGAGFLTSRLTLDKDLDKIDFILDNYRKYYYDEKENVVGIFSDALLDRYSTYYTKEEYAAIISSDKGEREGLGVVIGERKDGDDVKIVIVDLYGNSPALKAGFRIGDEVKSIVCSSKELGVDSVDRLIEAIAGEKAYEDIVFKVLRGESELTVTVQKQSYRETFVRYYDASGEYAFMDEDSGAVEFVRVGDNYLFPFGDDDNTALIKYYGFSGTDGGLGGSAGQFARVMEKFKSDGKKNVLLDLRDNGGGFLHIMQEVSRYFTDVKNGERPVVVAVKDKFGNEELYRSEPVRYNDYGFENIVVLANSGTASASEALIGAMLDYDERGIVKVIVSDGRTYGKGIMQTTFTRVSGDAIKLTTAKLFWPTSKRCIHDVGVTTATDERVYDETSYGSAFYDGLEFCR